MWGGDHAGQHEDGRANEAGRKTVYLVPGENYDPPEERPFDFNPTGA